MEAVLNRLFQALSIFVGYFDDSTVLFVGAVGLAIGLLAFSVMFLVSQSTNKHYRRIRKELQSDVSVSIGSRGSKKIDRAISPIRSIVVPKSNSKELSYTSRRLISAGYRHSASVSVYYFWKLVLTLGLGLIVLYATTFFPTLTTLKIVLFTGAAAFFGSIFPSYILDKKVIERKRRIMNAFPDMLDMLVACSEAGLGLNAALQRVSEEIEPSFPELGEELALVNAEMLAGVDRIKALRGLAERTDIRDIQGFVAMLSQSVRFGTGIAETLRIYAEEFRDKRLQRAEEMAAKVGTKILFPLIFCFFPSFFLVAVGPAIIAIGQAFTPA